MGAKGAGNPVGFMGSLSVTHTAIIFQLGCKGCSRKKVTQNDITGYYVSTTHAVHDFNQCKLLHIAASRLLEKINSLTFGLMLTLRMLFHTEAPT